MAHYNRALDLAANLPGCMDSCSDFRAAPRRTLDGLKSQGIRRQKSSLGALSACSQPTRLYNAPSMTQALPMLAKTVTWTEELLQLATCSITADTVQKQVENELMKLLNDGLECEGSRTASTMSFGACEAVGGSSALAMPVACAVEMFIAASRQLSGLSCSGRSDSLPLAIEGALSSLQFLVPADRLDAMTSELCRHVIGASSLPEAVIGVDSHKCLPSTSVTLAECSISAAAAAAGASPMEADVLRTVGQHIGQSSWMIGDLRKWRADEDVCTASYTGLVGVEAVRLEAGSLLDEATKMLWGMAKRAGRPASSIATLLSVIAKLREQLDEFVNQATYC